MTTVAAVARDGQVWMAADSMTTVWDRPVFTARKIVRRDGVLMGMSGDGAIAPLLRQLELPAQDDGDMHDWAQLVAHTITTAAVRAGLVDDGRMNSTVLLGSSGQLWNICHGQAIWLEDGVGALGSGEGIAMGAMDVLLGMGEHPPHLIVQRAVHAAIVRDLHSAGPIVWEHL